MEYISQLLFLLQGVVVGIILYYKILKTANNIDIAILVVGLVISSLLILAISKQKNSFNNESKKGKYVETKTSFLGKYEDEFKDKFNDKYEDEFKDKYEDEFKDKYEDEFKDKYEDEFKDEFDDKYEKSSNAPKNNTKESIESEISGFIKDELHKF
jgi:hypothetical protein